MYDAEIAMTLMNRWDDGRMNRHDATSVVTLLREGGLQFRWLRGFVETGRTSDCSLDGWELECLMFEDGSRALRLMRSPPNCAVTRWTAMQPTHSSVEKADDINR